MNSIWLAVLQKAVQYLLAKDWNAVTTQVAALWNSQMTGDQKRQIVFETLRSAGVSAAMWLLYAGIEIAYGAMKAKLDETKST